ncbi:MAG: peptide chain release factor-like protein [Bdellovibrionales bacterium]|nr:peptide chain release factor-like protein [Bdellovibrionales bacterium]
MERLGIDEKDIIENFIRGSGSGGQKINKTSSCVQLLHKPSGIEVKCQQERSQAMNRYIARRELCDKLEEQIEGKRSKAEQEREKIRRQKRKRSKRAKEKMLQEKLKRSEVKESRKKPSTDG